MLNILYGVIIDEDMIGRVSQLKYVDHDIIDMAKLPEISLYQYLKLRIDPVMNQIILIPKVWERGLEQEGILSYSTSHTLAR
jgi:hypothetical protein